MKPSHTTTPRTLNDAVFLTSADPIERPTKRPNMYWRFINWLLK